LAKGQKKFLRIWWAMGRAVTKKSLPEYRLFFFINGKEGGARNGVRTRLIKNLESELFRE